MTIEGRSPTDHGPEPSPVPGDGRDGPADDTPVSGGKPRPVWTKLLSAAITVMVLVIVFGFVVPRIADYEAVASYLGGISTTRRAVLVVMSLWFLLAYPIVLVTVIRTLRLREAFVNHMTGTAITNSVPSGGAIALGVNYAMYLSWGFTPESVSAGLLAAGVWDWYARIALPILAVVAIAIVSVARPWMWVVSIGGVAWVAFSVWLLVTVLRSDRVAEVTAAWVDRVAGRIAGWLRRDRPAAHDAVLRFRAELRGVVGERSGRLTAATINNHLAMAGLYTACVYAVGVSPSVIPVPWVVLSFALGRFLVMIPVSPGGLGLVDLGWIGLLTLGWQTTAPDVPVNTDLIAAGVLLFRALTLFPPIVVGMGSWIFWRINRSWRADWRTERRGETAR
jgi:putative heme transporter